MFNSDQGSQYTSKAHTDILKRQDIKISMDGIGRATDNIAIERFWCEPLSMKKSTSMSIKT
ncbi:MAG TPA: transposase [Campylobacterales bacterium]|nr:transposase [Campylobacterales bacterium]